MLSRGITILSLVFIPSVAWAQPEPLSSVKCFGCIYAWQEAPPITSEGHTWATVIRVTPAAEGVAVERHTISWLPAKVDIQVFSPRAETGRNFTLEETLALSQTRPKQIRMAMWGPYEIPRENLRGLRQTESRARIGHLSVPRHRLVRAAVADGKLHPRHHGHGPNLRPRPLPAVPFR